jgi:hypothetical protein
MMNAEQMRTKRTGSAVQPHREPFRSQDEITVRGADPTKLRAVLALPLEAESCAWE